MNRFPERPVEHLTITSTPSNPDQHPMDAWLRRARRPPVTINTAPERPPETLAFEQQLRDRYPARRRPAHTRRDHATEIARRWRPDLDPDSDDARELIDAIEHQLDHTTPPEPDPTPAAPPPVWTLKSGALPLDDTPPTMSTLMDRWLRHAPRLPRNSELHLTVENGVVTGSVLV